jgi:hypothetical protein
MGNEAGGNGRCMARQCDLQQPPNAITGMEEGAETIAQAAPAPSRLRRPPLRPAPSGPTARQQPCMPDVAGGSASGR